MTQWNKSTGTITATVSTEQTIVESSANATFQISVDLSNMDNGTQVVLRRYNIINTSYILSLENWYANVQAIPLATFQPLGSQGIGNGVKYTILQNQGSAHAFDWISLTDTSAAAANVTYWVNQIVPAANTNGIPKVDIFQVSGVALNAANAQIGVNLVNIAGAAVSTTTAQIGVNAVKYNNQVAVTDGNNLPSVNVVDIAGSASTGSSGFVGIDWSQIANKTSVVDLTQTIISKVSGDVGGNILGNVNGSVASVTGAVGSVTATVNSNVTSWGGSGLSAVNVSGVPVVDLVYTRGISSTGQAGSVGIDWGQIVNKTASVDLTQTIISSVSGSVQSVTGNVAGSVGSVVGAVGSVTGNVGGNVVGSVASVTNPVAITSNVKKNQLVSAFPFTMYDNTTNTPRTGLTVTATRSLDGGTFGACANAPFEIANGDYALNLAAADLNANTVMLRFIATSAFDTNISLVTQP